MDIRKTSRHSAGRRGISMVLVIILVVVTIFLVFTSLLLYSQWADLERIQKGLTKQYNTEQGVRDIRMAEIRQQLPATGFFKAETDVKELTDAAPKAELEKRT